MTAKPKHAPVPADFIHRGRRTAKPRFPMPSDPKVLAEYLDMTARDLARWKARHETPIEPETCELAYAIEKEYELERPCGMGDGFVYHVVVHSKDIRPEYDLHRVWVATFRDESDAEAFLAALEREDAAPARASGAPGGFLAKIKLEDDDGSAPGE